MIAGALAGEGALVVDVVELVGNWGNTTPDAPSCAIVACTVPAPPKYVVSISAVNQFEISVSVAFGCVL